MTFLLGSVLLRTSPHFIVALGLGAIVYARAVPLANTACAGHDAH